MYTTLWDRPEPAEPQGRPEGGPPTGNVVGLGLTSCFTDISSEMVNAVLPLYLTAQMGFSPVAFGLFDGAYQGTAGVLRLVGGLAADGRGRHKEAAAAGYALSAAAKVGLLAAPAGAATTAILLADRTGKGVRTAPRDALISLSAEPGRLGEAFGLHRALDTAGALIGPIVAFFLLRAANGDYTPVFLASFSAAMVGLAILGMFVRNVSGPPSGTLTSGRASFPWRDAGRLFALPAFRRLVLGGLLLALVTVSDAFAYLVLARRIDLPPGPFPLLFVGTALSYLVMAVPCGRLADRIGRRAVFVAGYAVLLIALAVLRFGPPTPSVAVVFLGLLGAFYAATDGVLMAMAAEALPERLRATGMAIVTTGTTFGRLVASAAFGLLWSWRGPEAAVSTFLVLLLAVLPVASRLLRGRPLEVAE